MARLHFPFAPLTVPTLSFAVISSNTAIPRVFLDVVRKLDAAVLALAQPIMWQERAVSIDTDNGVDLGCALVQGVAIPNFVIGISPKHQQGTGHHRLGLQGR